MTTENSRADALTPEEIQDRLHRFFSKRNTSAMTAVSVTEFVVELLAASAVEQPAAAPIVELPPRVIDKLYQSAGVCTYHPDGDQTEKLHAAAHAIVREAFARIPSAAPAPADERAAGLIEQHHRDSAELRRLCEARDEARRTAEYWKAEHNAANARIAELERASANETGAEGFTYATKQATTCAGCGERKHTPLRIDWMGGYVCLTCIDRELESRSPAMAAEAVALPQPVLDALRFYANGHHFNIDEDHQQFDTVSGEPQNWLFSERDDDCTMIEDGRIAKAVLQGIAAPFEEPPPPIEGEVFAAAQPAQADARVGHKSEGE
ncbi:hypothetical protein [Burkholderia cenocepacia]